MEKVIKNNYHKNVLFFMLFYISCDAQRLYKLNGNIGECGFTYMCYAQNSDYLSVKRPFIFILINEQESLESAFQKDTLKLLPNFYNYQFVYIPNNSSEKKEKLKCIEALTNLLTYHFTYGKQNLFFIVKDTSIHRSDLESYGLNSDFKFIQLYSEHIDSAKNQAIVNLNINDFKENTNDYLLSDKQDAEVNDNDKYGTFYEEEDKEKESTEVGKTIQKIYFGPPQNFQFTLSGVVKDKSTGEVLPFATIKIRGSGIVTATNTDGFFTLLKTPNDTCSIEVQYIGYEKGIIYLTPQTPKKNLIVELKPSAQNLKTVTIVGYKEDVVLVSKTDVSTIKMTPKKLEQLPNIGERDIMRSFQLMPGVSASNESSSGLYVRGGTPDQNLVLYDGFTIYHVDHLYGFFSAFNSNALKDVQLYKGGFESKFGGRLSSVTEITGKEGNQNKFNIGADLSLLSANVFVEVPIGKKFSSVIAFRRSYQGFIYNKIFSKFNNNSKSNSNAPSGGPGGIQSQNTKATSFFYDLNGKFTYKPSSRDVISLSIFNGMDKLDNSSSMDASGFGASNSNFSSSTTDLTKYGNIGSSIKWSRKWTERFYNNTTISYSNYFSKRDRSQERSMTNSSGETTTTKNGIFENNDLKDYSIKSDFQYDAFKFSQIQFGGFGTLYDIKYTYAQNDTTTVLDKKNKAILTGIYLQNKLKLFDNKLSITPGIRSSYFQTTKKWYYEPRLNFTYQVSSKITLKAATGKYYQFANRVTREDILSGSRDFWLLSDGTSVPVSSAIHYIAGVSYENNNYLFSAEVYYKDLKNLTEYSLRFNPSPKGVNYNENFYTGKGFSKGIEFLLQRKIGQLNGWLSYTLGQSRSYFPIYSDSYYPSNQDVTHEFKIVGLYKYKRWDFSITWIYATGRPYTAPSGAYTVTLLDGSSKDYFTVTAKNSLRLPDYHRMDLAVNYKLLAGQKGDKKRREIGYIGFSIFNLYNRTNVWYKQYTISDGEIIETNVNYLGIVPNLTLSLKLR